MSAIDGQSAPESAVCRAMAQLKTTLNVCQCENVEVLVDLLENPIERHLGVSVAGPRPQNELGDVHPAIARFTVVYPGLRFFQPCPKISLTEVRFLA